LNLQEKPTEPYFACPYCLTKIKTIEKSVENYEIPKENEVKKTPEISQFETKEKSKNNDKATVCLYHPGFLSERSSKEQIPDDCLVCKDIVECMLKKMRD
jgi:hypothetical protein